MFKRRSEDEAHGITRGADLPIPIDELQVSSREPPNGMLVFTIIALVLAVSVILFKYAIDVLFIVVVLSVFGFLISRLIQWLADTELLTPGWTIPILLVLAVVGWLTWPLVSSMSPMRAFERSLQFEAYFPTPVVRFLKWSEQRGWARRLLVPAESSQVGHAVQTSRPLIVLTVRSAQTSVRAGLAVTVIATLEFASPPAPSAPKTVQLLDGGKRIAAVPFALAGRVATASYTTTGLAVGAHSIRARYEPVLPFGAVTSPPLSITVTP